MSGSAWVRTEDNFYGAGRFPYGQCARCDAPACHGIPQDGREIRVCTRHLPPHLVFVPFLGQQTKLFAANERWVLGGGGAGPGKTHAGARLWLKQWNHEQARFVAAGREKGDFRSKGWSLFLRRTIPELLQVVEDFKRYFHRIDPAAKWNENSKYAQFTNGYRVQFGGMEDDDSYLKYYGGEYSLIVMDEATAFTKKQIEEIDARLRCSDPELEKMCQFYMLTNPVGGETKAWLRRRFVKIAPPETRVKVEVKLLDGRMVTEWQKYIPCNLYDNPALMASGKYEASLKRKSDAMRRALLENDWDVDEGSWIGDDWDPNVHTCEPFAIPKTWPRFKCADYGYSSKSAILWFASDPDGNLICYRAVNVRKMTARELGFYIRELEKRPLTYQKKGGKRVVVTEGEWDDARDVSNVPGPMDSSLWASYGEDGESRGEILEVIGTGFFPADKGKNVRHSAAEQIRNRIRSRTPDAKGSLDPGIPGLRFFRHTTETRIADPDGGVTVTGPIHTIPVLPFDAKDPDVPDTKADDHDWDALAYGVMSRPDKAPSEEDQIIDFMSFRAAARGGSKKSRVDW